MALCEAHNHQFGEHNAALKTYIRISSSYYWTSCGPTSSSTQKHDSDASRERNLWTNLRHYIHYQIRNARTSGSMLIFSAQCWQLVASTNKSCASRTHLSNTCSSRQSRTRRQKLWQRPFSMNNFANSAFRHKSTLTAGRSLSTSSPKSSFNYLMFNTQKQLRPIPSVMPRLKFLIKPLISI